jgi:hypothetical protein
MICYTSVDESFIPLRGVNTRKHVKPDITRLRTRDLKNHGLVTDALYFNGIINLARLTSSDVETIR